MKVRIMSVHDREDGFCDVVVVRDKGLEETYTVKSSEDLLNQLQRIRAIEADRQSLKLMIGTVQDI